MSEKQYMINFNKLSSYMLLDLWLRLPPEQMSLIEARQNQIKNILIEREVIKEICDEEKP